MGKGKAKRRRESNFNSSHPHPHPPALLLPPPPSTKHDRHDDDALPSKLRNIIRLKASILHHHHHHHQQLGHNNQLRGEGNQPLKGSKSSKGSLHGMSVIVKKLEDKQQGAVKDPQKQQALSELHERVEASSSKKRKRGEDMKKLMESLRVAPVHKGIREQRKKYLQEKKTKKRKIGKGKGPPSLRQQEFITFGEVVQAPPKLSAPIRGLELKHGASSNLSQERRRLQAVEAYRQRKGWKSRPGINIPFDHAPDLPSM